eukprot:XP_002259749.1 hypothetical protein, conserved in Plasmodium species [Plasmodium knowlesi strain H]
MNHNEGRCNFVVHEGKETVCGQWGVDERRGMVAKGNLPCRNENRNGLQQSYEGGELFNLKRGVQRDSPRKTTQEGCAIFPKEQHADGGRNQKNGWTGQSKSGGTGQNKSGGIGQNKSRCTKKRSNIEEEKELPSGEHTPDEGKKENYVTYCEDGYLRELLKNALVNPSMKAFLGTRVISFLNEKERHNLPPGNVPTDGVPPQEELFDVLKICSLYFQNVGYCQGMNYVAAILFLVLKDKLYTARCFIALLKKFNLKGMYILKFPQLKKIMYQLKVLIKGYFPKLFSYFRRKKIKIDFFCINWFMTLFAQDLTFDQTVKLWDSFLLFGLKILIKVSLVFLCHFEKDILSLSYEEALTFLKSITRFPFTDHLFEEENFFAYLGRFKVTNRTLKQIIFLRKNGIKFEVHVREVCHRGVQTNRCSVVLCENGGWREKMVQEIGGTCSTIHNGDNLMHRFMGIFRGVVDNRTGVSFGKTVGERKRRPPSRRANQAICTNFFLDPSRSNEVTPENQCLSLNFNSGLFCGVKERSRYLRGDSTICEGTTREEEATAEDECSARPTGNASIETNTYYDLNLTKSFR